MSTLVNVIFDSITNTVFAGQVLAPLVKLLDDPKITRGVLVSFEPKQSYEQACVLAKTISHPKLTVEIKKRLPFLCGFFLRLPARQLQKLLRNFSGYILLARGPLAGIVCQYALDKKRCAHLTIQARGLLAQEYWYMGSLPSFFLRFRFWCYERAEKRAYGVKQPCAYMIQSVSQALSQYLIENFGACEKNIVFAVHDIPPKIEPEIIKNWREKTRTKLGVSPDATVFCFSGAAHDWQLPDLVIEYFCEQYKKDNKSFLLLLTKDTQKFKSLLDTRVPENSYKILWVSHDKVFEYLAACDVGLMFRDASPVSWVARPVKAMEYEAVGLRVVHNNTVKWLVDRFGGGPLV